MPKFNQHTSRIFNILFLLFQAIVECNCNTGACLYPDTSCLECLGISFWLLWGLFSYMTMSLIYSMHIWNTILCKERPLLSHISYIWRAMYRWDVERSNGAIQIMADQTSKPAIHLLKRRVPGSIVSNVTKFKCCLTGTQRTNYQYHMCFLLYLLATYTYLLNTFAKCRMILWWPIT